MPRPTTAALLLALLLLPLPLAQGADPPTRPHDLAAIDAYIEREMARARIPGVALAIVRDGSIAHARGFGEAAAGREVTTQTPFLIASVTKTLTAVLILQLAEEGAVALDAPVRAYLPSFEVATLGASERITLRHLLSHTSGLPPLLPGEYDRILGRPPAPDDVAREIALLRDVELWSAPGERHQYSNVGYVVLAGVIEAVTGRAYEEVLTARVLVPAGMAHAHTTKEAARADGIAQGHRMWLGRPIAYDWTHSRAGIGAGFTYASAEDLASFALALLDAEGSRVLAAGALAAMQTPVAEVPGGAATASHYGLGLFVGTLHGARIAHHAGVAPDFRADLILLPAQGTAVVVLANANDAVRPAAFDALALGVASILLGEEPPAPRAGRSFLATVRDVTAIGDVVLLGVAALTLRAALRARRASSRAAWALAPAILLGGAWAALSFIVVPGLLRWPLRGLAFTAPEVGHLVVASGAAALAWIAIAFVLAARTLTAARPSRG